MQNRKTILLVHQSFIQTGGATAVGAWIIQALKKDFELTLLTWNSVDLEALNRFQGTSIKTSEVKILKPNPIIRTVLGLDPDPNSVQPVAYLMRLVHSIRKNYDLVIASGTEEMDLGGTGLVYVHFPHLARFWSKYRDCEGLSLLAQLRAMLRGETRPWIVLANYSVERFKRATLLANSEWTAGEVRISYDLAATLLYPPSIGSSTCRDWNARENGFLCVGRLAPAKRMDAVISVLRRVRERQPGLTLHLAGPRPIDADYDDYFRKLCGLANQNRDWVTLHEHPSRDELADLMGRIRYGIHANPGEHFGIAPAEMVASGCIVFVHNSGGQVEIVGRDPRLCYNDDEDAIEKIASVAASPELQAALLDGSRERRTIFSAAHFVQTLRGIVDRLIQQAEGQASR